MTDNQSVNKLPTRSSQSQQLWLPVASNPMDGLTTEALGQRLGEISAVTVREREQEGVLFSVLNNGRTHERLRPAFQV